MSGSRFGDLAKQPILLQRNRVWRTYSGGQLIDRLQGSEQGVDGSMPEEWVASVVRATNVGREHIRDEGLSTVKLADGSLVTLRAMIESDPDAFLGEAHVSRYGAHTAVLVKLLDSSERLTIQVHPDRRFAMDKFQSRFGKTEAWYVIGGREIDGEEPYVLFGFKPEVSAESWRTLFETQNIPGMLDALHRIPVREGDVFLVEGGVPHAIGSGCFLIEIQEPTDYTLRTERTTPAGAVIPDSACHQGLGFDVMLECFHYDNYTLEQIKERWYMEPAVLHETSGGQLLSLIKPTDTDRFSMNRLTVTSDYELDHEGGFAIAVVVDGQGSIVTDSGVFGVKQGDNLFLPASMPVMRWTSEGNDPLQVILCYPPMN